MVQSEFSYFKEALQRFIKNNTYSSNGERPLTAIDLLSIIEDAEYEADKDEESDLNIPDDFNF